MLKRLIKVAFAASVLTALSSTTYAEVKVVPYGEMAATFGQYSNTAKVTARDSAGAVKTADAAEAAHFDSYIGAKLGMRVTAGDVEAIIETYKTTSDSEDYPATDGVEVTWKFHPSMSAKISTGLTMPGAVGATFSSGLGKDISYSLGTTEGLVGYMSAPGMQLTYDITPKMNINLGIFSDNPTTSVVGGGQGFLALLSMTAGGKPCSNCKLNYLFAGSKKGALDSFQVGPFTLADMGIDNVDADNQEFCQGSGNSLSFVGQGIAGLPLIVAGVYTTGQRDQNDAGPTDPGNSMLISGKLYLSKTMNISFDYGTRLYSFFTGIKNDAGTVVDGTVKTSAMGLMFEIGAGPGSVVVAYHTSELTTEALGVEIKSASATKGEQAIHYDIPMCDEEGGVKCKAQFLYVAASSQAGTDGADNDVQSVLGARFNVVF